MLCVSVVIDLVISLALSLLLWAALAASKSDDDKLAEVHADLIKTVNQFLGCFWQKRCIICFVKNSFLSPLHWCHSDKRRFPC